MESVIPLIDGECVLVERFLNQTRADRFFLDIRQTALWHQPQLNLFGKVARSPRLAAWYGDPGAVYTYSGLVNRPLPWFEGLCQLRRRIEGHTGARFNSVLINLYRDGNDAMGWHSDDEAELVPGAVIASLSLGATRRFAMRHKRRPRLAVVNIALHHGSLLLMRGQTQQHWRHALPRTRQTVGARINLTFRRVRIADAPGSTG
ncbi:MAG: alpha-ketoglutarate-dependent dioxygenase AlkB [Gammaproteobacteria bacterium]|nr:alpha-ketoglutarate-dependent dioxygenase AlkB [Gammaproteobacteria bacterium]